MKKVVWIVFALVALAWTASAWLMAEALRWVGAALSQQAGAAGADLAQLASNWSLPSWVLLWVDAQAVQAAQLAVVDLLEWLQATWPGIGYAMGWLVPVVWFGWGVGLLVLLMLALLAHWLVSRNTGSPAKSVQPAA